MITTVLATNKTEFQKYIEQLKVKGKRIFSPDEVEYLANCDGFEAVELKQEDVSIFARASSLPPNNSNIWNGMLQSASKRIMDGSTN